MKKYIIWVVLILVSLPVTIPFLKPGFFPTHDGEWAIVRLAEMHREFKDLQIPPRWSGYLNHGYGYPLFLFTYPFPYYLGELLHVSGLGLTDSIKALFIISVFGSVVAMFLLGKELWGTNGGIISSILYLYAPYRFINLYIRGQVGESLAFVFFPLLFWLFCKLGQKNSPKLFFLTVAALATFILTHNAMVVLYTSFLLGWLGYLLGRKPTNKNAKKVYVITLVTALFLTAYFWLPAVFEKSYVALSQTALADKAVNFMTVRELFSTAWHFGIRPPLQVGIVHLLTGLLSVVLGIVIVWKNKEDSGPILFLSGFFFLALFMLFKSSNVLWQIPIVKEVDFPWRMLGIVTFLVSLVSGYVGKMRYGWVGAVAISLMAIYVNGRYIETQPRLFKPDIYYETNDATTTSADELMPVWIKNKPTNRPTIKAKIIPTGEAIVVKETSQELDFAIEVPSDIKSQVVVNQLFFPGWRAKIDGEDAPLAIQSNFGLISIYVPWGRHTLEIKFDRTPIRLIADIMTLSGGIACFILWKNSKRFFH